MAGGGGSCMAGGACVVGENGNCSGQYTSYWNAFLYYYCIQLVQYFMKINFVISESNFNFEFELQGNGTLEFDEFLRMMTTRNKQGVTRWESSKDRRSEPEAWRAFKVFDRDRNGFISAVELKETMRELGVHITDEDAACMIKEADLDGDGKINYQGMYCSFAHPSIK